MHLVADVAVQTYPLAAEGPVWCVKQQCLYYVDMAHKAKGKLHCYNPVKKADVVYDIPALHPPITQVTAVAPCRSCATSVAIATDAGMFRFDTQSCKVEPLCGEMQPGLQGYRTNDGKCDPRGRFLVGTMLYTCDGTAGGLFSVEKDGSGYTTRQLVKGTTISNGLAWSADGAVLYYIDSPLKKIDAFDYDLDTGSVSNRRTAFDFAPYFESEGLDQAVPDGMTIDTEGMLWVAIHMGARVVRVDPAAAQVIGKVECNAQCTTCPIFGGPELDTLYVTSIRLDDPNPDAGAVFECKVPAKGLPSFEFDD